MRALFLLGYFFFISEALAWSWHEVWSTPDQTAQKMMNKGQFQEASQLFKRADWRAVSAYRAGNYKAAYSLFSTLNGADAYYNQGNALAYMGKYKEAINAYKHALRIEPGHKDALYNRRWLEAFLKKQDRQKQDQQKQDQQKQDQQKQGQQEQDQQKQGQQEQGQQEQDQQKQDQQKQDQQKQGQQEQDQQKQGQQEQDQQKQGQQEQDQQKQGQQEQDQKSRNIEAPMGQNQDKVSSSQARESQQAKEQWLGLIPDDPGGLMREKFLRDHLRRQQGWEP